MKFGKIGASIVLTALGATSVVAQPYPSVTLLTYNVKGLPWPVASDRPAALNTIAQQLLALRRQGRQPHLVALQEAFVSEAKAIGRASGYRYEAFGPGQDEAPLVNTTPQDRAFTADASFMIGERAGKRVDSGLAIFSDYPIIAVRRMAYPICAGYDCLANKGALAVLIAVPGLAAPLTVIDTHLNSGTASGAPRARSTYAYRRQIDALRVLISSVASSGSPVLIAGDFNVGYHMDRRSYFAGQLLGLTLGLSAVEQACGRNLGCTAGSPGGVAESIRHGKDWLLYRPSRLLAPMPTDLAAPFGRAADGSMLSDHVGVTVTYAFSAPLHTAPRRFEVASR
jgi:endonuclease/exonuclease/phosphatase family metal-dependent hydrolase